MKKVLIILSVLIFVSGINLQGEVIATFPDLLKPTSLVIDEDRLYITQDITVFIYSMKDFKLIKKFGKAGEGPQEFNRFVGITPLKDKLLINSMSKISYFKKDGTYISEMRTKGGITFGYQPLGDKYVSLGIEVKDNIRYRTINLYDSELNKVKTLLKNEDDNQVAKGSLKILNTTLNYMTFDEKLYLINGKEFEIKVFDKTAKEVLTIKRDNYKKRKFTEEDKQDIFDLIKADPRQKQFFDMVKKMAVFPDKWPALASVFERDNIIYVSTFNAKGKTQYEFFLFDSKGKFIHNLFIPMKFQDALRPFPMSIKNGKLYQLIENEDEEEWELHSNFIHNTDLTKFNKVSENINQKTKLK
ncbi:MAG: hypothetical protein ABFR75_12325 [Acidobacteriota bacterium]